jgi:hypothetical protein
MLGRDGIQDMYVAYLGKSNSVRVHRVRSSRVRAIGSVAHGSIQCCPYWAEDVARWVQRGLLQRSVCRLRDACCIYIRDAFLGETVKHTANGKPSCSST